MKGNVLHLAEGRVLVEQLGLVLGHAWNSLIPAIFLALLVEWTLSDGSNAPGVRLWCAAAILAKLGAASYARSVDLSGVSPQCLSRIVWKLMALHAIEGTAWGALAWVALDGASLTNGILVIAMAAGIAGSSMSAFAPVLPVYLAFSGAIMLTLAPKLWLMNAPAYHTLGTLAALYVPMLFIQARTSAAATRAAIELRFENVELVVRLRAETAKAQAARRDAEQANLSKSRFLAAASHDLRQPVHAQGLFLEVLARSGLSAIQKDALASVRAANEATAEMLNTLLDFSRIEAGVVEPHVRAFHLQPLLNKIENELAPQADAKGLVYRSRETHAAVESDPALVELILRNLVSNAIRYTAQGGVLVVCRVRGGCVLLEIWDTGIGIEHSQQKEVFREFCQLGNPERDRNKGLGLGLAIAKGLARAMGHELSLASVPGRGSVFRLAIPVARAAVTSDELEGMLGMARSLDVRVLVIDDDEAVRAGMAQLLRGWGCACIAVESIDEALAAVRAYPPDIVISDYHLREQQTGAEVIATLRAEFDDNLPAILITGDTAPERLREAHASGVPLLHKPVSPSRLYQRLIELLAPEKPCFTRRS